MRLPSYVAFVCILVLSAGVGAPLSAAGEDPLTARAFDVRHRPVSDAAELVGELLSADGSLTIKPKLKILVVEDRLSVLERVADLLESFDLPPRRVDVTLSLFMGTRSRPKDSIVPVPSGADQFSSKVRGVIEAVGDFTKWTEYESLGSRAIPGVEGEPVTAEVAGDYRVQFKVGSVSEKRRVVRFDRFTLQKRRLSDIGDTPRTATYEDLYTAAMVVDAGKLTLVVAASAPDSQQALFLALQADPR